MTAFERFYAEEHPGVLAVLAAITGSWELAEDHAQEAFARALDRWDVVAEHPNPAAWVRRVAINLARSGHRRHRTEQRYLPQLLAPASRADEPPVTELEAFWHAVAELPRNQAAAIALYFLYDLDPAAIGAELGCAPATARVHLHRARRKLRQTLAPHFDAEASASGAAAVRRTHRDR